MSIDCRELVPLLQKGHTTIQLNTFKPRKRMLISVCIITRLKIEIFVLKDILRKTLT